MIIVVTGPESVGKTTMCKALAAHYGGEWEPEYARTYLELMHRHYDYEDVEHIARMQYLTLCNYRRINSPKPVFLDTYLIITKIWFRLVFNRIPEWIDFAVRSSVVDLVLLLKPDMPWEEDPLRENGSVERRNYLFHLYKSELLHYGIPFRIVGGNGEQRVINCVNGIDEFLLYK